MAFAASHGAGDRAALEVLGKRPKQSAPQVAACVRALGLIGGEIALEVLATYRTTGNEGRFGDTFPDPVAREIAAAWRAFDRAAFAEALFGGARTLRLMQAGPLDDLSGFAAVPTLTDLQVQVGPSASLGALTHCPLLEELVLAHEEPVDLSPLPAMNALRMLGVSVFSSEQLGYVAACASTLTRLVLHVRGPIALAPLLSPKELSILQLSTLTPHEPEALLQLAAAVRRGMEMIATNPACDTSRPGACANDGMRSVVLTPEKEQLLASLRL